MQEIDDLKTKFENLSLPYKVDIIDVDEVDNNFKENILNNEVLWIKR